jgi:hypothetical protein
MGLPAFLQPPTASGDVLRPLDPVVEAACSALWDQARAAWATRPSRGSEGEAVASRATFNLVAQFTQALAGHSPTALRAYVNEGLRRIVREQRAAAEDDRTFALRQLEQALEHYAVAVETLTAAGDADDGFAEIAAVVGEAEGPMPDELRPFYRANGALLMAFETMGAEQADDFRFWAREAVELWRGVVAALPALTAMLRGARAHLRARLAWDSWTDEDRAVERDAWKTLR